MSKYEVKTSDGIVHQAEAATHFIDANGLHLHSDAGRVVGVFREFLWMRITNHHQPESYRGVSHEWRKA
ncbi:hypothetical protein ACV349_12715 [Pseudomonas aeruginosa]|uniref:hypothetical protein n=1 Tax=Pseudomonas aeruginosa TaxID=287 RepID=UPI00066E6829|nr:hypothetical protein [Pseudomonas aeruginosa]MBG5241867.1 hypothetical protein [Pseudomonas aeruginosa]MCL9915859.1 hypothetical protein [Pseudomonas aeruginosa]MEA8821118.1 hypothetical protein [Pseudomonas aeruginosa]RTX02272.1 hypothetical protein DZA14_30595 [Pseudomonas aeruginosa]HBO0837660.1 hypothetical protein [Pseudomonas aeruginosa]